MTFRGIGEDDELGRSLHGLGDVNGDGRADFIIGAHGVRPSGVYEAGAAYVIFGGQSLPPLVTGPDLAAAGQEYDGIDAGDKAGWSVTGAGDMNRDFGGDFAVSAKGADPLGRSNAGETYLFFGEPIEPPTALACSADGGTVTVTWTNGELYDTVVIIRDGVVIATLPGTDSSFVDTGVAPGLHSYEIYGTIGIFRSAATAECVVDIPPPPENPTCSAIGDTPTITWSNPVIYDEIRVSRNGVLIATLAGTETSYDDPGLAPGIYLYEVRGVVGGTPSDPAQCSAEVLAPITDFVCSAIAHTVFLSWTNGQAYSFIELFRDGILEAELPGATNSYTDLEVPAGLHTYSLVAHGPSTETLPVACEIVVLDQPFNAACTSENGFVTLTWQNGSVYDGIEIERNGVLVATLPGTATIFTETVPPGTYLYEITGTAPNSESAKTPCEVVAPGCPSGLQCSAVGEEATLTWVNAELYDDVLVTLDGTVIQTLAGDATATGISPLAPGTYTICVVGVINGGTCEACCELTVPIPPTNAACSAVGNVVTLTWTNGETYDFIDILRNGVQIDTVAGSMESYTDTEVPVGLHTYGIVATIDGGTTLPLPCEVEVLPPISVECAAEAGNVTLSWSPGGEYDTVEILRDGVLIAQVPGVEGSFIDEGVAPGTYVYTLTGLSGTSQTDPVDCTVIVPEPVIELECSLADGVTVTLEWTNVEVEGTVLVLRNEQLITTLGGSVSTYTEGPMAPGVYVYCVINEIDGNTSVPTCCEVVVPVPPTMLLCHSTVEGPEVAWMNGEAYDSILVFRDGVLLDELAGDAESYLDPGLPAGEYEYRIIGVVQGFHSAPATCTVSVPHPPEVTCSEQNPNFVLNITLLSTFESIVVLRNGEQVAQVAPIPGTVFEHHDQVPLPGSYFYEVIGVVGDEDVSQPGECNGVMLVFVRGDANNDMELDIADIVWILNYLFQDGPPPPCMDAADTNSDGFVNVADAVYMAGYLFLDGLPPEAPFPTPGLDPYDPAVEEPEDKDQLGCASSVWD
ncbi:MAG: hypothetical protein ACE5GW_00855 [Planctomycetota bacterium]